MGRVEKAGLRVDEVLADFINQRALPASGVEPQRFWEGLSTLIHDFGPRNRALLEKRDALQAAIDGGIGYPCVVKPVMSSSGKGQSKLDGPADVGPAWQAAMAASAISSGVTARRSTPPRASSRAVGPRPSQ